MAYASQGWVKDLLKKVLKKCKDEGLDNYSTEEIVIGKWIDGKPLYRKMIDIGNLPNNTTKKVNPNIENLDNVTKLYGMGVRNDGYIYPLPLLNNSGITNCIMVTYSKKESGDTIDIRTYADYSVSKGWVVIEYTKTTD